MSKRKSFENDEADEKTSRSKRSISFKPDPDSPFWSQLLEEIPFTLKKTLPLRCAGMCDTNYTSEHLGDIDLSKESLFHRDGCNHVWHPSCLKFAWFQFNLSSWGDTYNLSDYDHKIPPDWCPVCSNRMGIPKYSNKDVYKYMCFPVSFGTICPRPEFRKDEIDQIAHLFETGEIVDCDGYRSRKLFIKNDDGGWTPLESDDPTYIPYYYVKLRGRKFYLENYSFFYGCMFETSDGGWEDFDSDKSSHIKSCRELH